MRAGQFTVTHIGAGGAENHEPGAVIIGDGVPDVAASDFPRAFAVPGLCSHLEFFRFVWLRRITRDSPKTPNFSAGLGVVSGERAAYGIVRAVVAHENFSLGHARRAGDAGLCWFANGGFPNFVGRGGIDGDESAIARADVHFAVPDGHAAVGARGIGPIQRLIEANLRIVLPAEFSRSGVDCINS